MPLVDIQLPYVKCVSNQGHVPMPGVRSYPPFHSTEACNLSRMQQAE